MSVREISLDFQFFSGESSLTTLEFSEGLFLDPDFADALQFLYRRLEAFVSRAAQQGHLRSATDVHLRIAKALENEVARWIQSETLLNRFFNIESGFLKLKRGVLSRRSTPGYGQVLVAQKSNGRILNSESLFLTELPAWAAKWRNQKNEKRSVGEVRPEVFASRELRVTHGGHAFLIVATPESCILVDPVFWPSKRENESQPFSANDLPQPEAVFLTHGHEDHLNFQFLLELDPKTAVYVPKTSESWAGANLAKILRLLGLNNVHEVESGEVVELSNGLTAEVFEFYGEARNITNSPGVVYGFRRGKSSVLSLADTSPDSSGRSILTDKIFKSSLEKNGPFKTVMTTWWQDLRFLYQTSPLVLMNSNIPIQDWLRVNEFCQMTPEFMRQLVELTKAKQICLYAENGSELFLPEGSQNEYVSSISLFWQSQEEFNSAISKSDCKLSQARPHDYWEL